MEAYDALVLFFQAILSIVFRQVKVRGSHRVPPEGTPILFVCAPHANQFLDPLMVISSCQRKVGFMMAKKPMKRFLVGLFSRNMNVIPVERPHDNIASGVGLIYTPQPYAAQPLLVRGIGTQFQSQIHPKSRLIIDKIEAPIDRVISDTELLLLEPFPSESGIVEKLTRQMSDGSYFGVEFKILPHIDHSQMFEAVIERLGAGECVGIFPEGGSHDHPTLLPLKAGVTIIALSAKAKYPNLNLHIIPVGLNYFNADKFRSRAVVEYGDPIEIPPSMFEQYARGGAEKRQACADLLDVVYKSLQNVTLNVPDFESLITIQAARRLYKPINRQLDLSETLAISRKFATAYVKLHDEPKVKALTARVLDYDRLLNYYGLKDHQVVSTKINGVYALSLLLLRMGILIVLGALALPGLLLNVPVFMIADRYALLKSKEALAASSVKLTGKDVVSTWRALASLALLPVFYIFHSVAACFLYAHYFPDLSIYFLAILTVLTFAFLPFVTLATIYMSDKLFDLVSSILPLALSVLSTGQHLRKMRLDLAVALTQCIEEFGHRVSPDFMKDRVITREDAARNLEQVRDAADEATLIPALFNLPASTSSSSLPNVTENEEEKEATELILHEELNKAS